MRRLNRRVRTILLAALLGALLAAFCAAALLIPESAAAPSLLDARKPPSWAHPFGTDALGRDLLVRVLKGMAVSLAVGAAASAVSAVIAVLVGVAAACGSRWVDGLVSWVIDLVMGVPHMVLIILISFALGRGLKGLLAGIAATHWCSLARLIRGEVMELRGRQYVAVSRHLGKSGGWILVHHLLPHLVPQFIVGLVLLFPHAILHEAGVTFLGFGLSPEQPAIGVILEESMGYLAAGRWWLALFPGLSLVLVVMLFALAGERLRLLLTPASAQE